MKHTFQKVTIGNKEHKIITGTYPEQCKEFYKALENNDACAAHFLHLPYVPRDIEMVQWEIDMLCKKEQFDRELERINNLPEELVRLEIELKIAAKEQK